MDMLYYIYIGSNRVTIDHLSKITGGMFMAVSSLQQSGESHRRYPRTVQHIHSLRRKHPSKGQPEHHFPAQALPPCLHHPHHRRTAEGTPQALSAGKVSTTPFSPMASEESLQQMTKFLQLRKEHKVCRNSASHTVRYSTPSTCLCGSVSSTSFLPLPY